MNNYYGVFRRRNGKGKSLRRGSVAAWHYACMCMCMCMNEGVTKKKETERERERERLW